MLFYGRYVCRIEPWPREVAAIFEAMASDPTVYSTMYVPTLVVLSSCASDMHLTICYCRIGPSEFFITGSLKDWSLLGGGRLHKVKAKTLLLNGRYDEAQDSVMCPFFRDIPRIEWHTFKHSSHMPHVEERDEFMRVVSGFLLTDD